MKNQILKIEKAEWLNEDYFILWVKDEYCAAHTKAGQFYELRKYSSDPKKLRKPISVYNVDKNYIGFFIKKLGRGTGELATLKRGDLLDLLGPLGNGFPLVESQKIALISGGIGYPPLWYLRRKLSAFNDVYWLHGGNSKADVFPCDEIWSMDGSIGNHGYVTQGLGNLMKFSEFNRIYACGPEPMLKQTAKLAREYGVSLYVSMEAYMACGVGVCHGCVIPTGSEANIVYKTVCKQGPVFDADEIVWSVL